MGSDLEAPPAPEWMATIAAIMEFANGKPTRTGSSTDGSYHCNHLTGTIYARLHDAQIGEVRSKAFRIQPRNARHIHLWDLHYKVLREATWGEVKKVAGKRHVPRGNWYEVHAD